MVINIRRNVLFARILFVHRRFLGKLRSVRKYEKKTFEARISLGENFLHSRQILAVQEFPSIMFGKVWCFEKKLFRNDISNCTGNATCSREMAERNFSFHEVEKIDFFAKLINSTHDKI